MRSVPSWRPASMAEGPDARALAAFLALARERVSPGPANLTPGRITLLGAVALVAAVLSAVWFRPASPWLAMAGVAMVVAGVALRNQAAQRPPRSVPEMVATLDDARQSTGLRALLPPDILENLEAVATTWERVEHALGDPVWRDHPVLRGRAERASTALVLEAMAREIGAPLMPRSPIPEAIGSLHDPYPELMRLAERVEVASRAVASYRRPEERPSGAPFGEEFPEVESLERALAALGV